MFRLSLTALFSLILTSVTTEAAFAVNAWGVRALATVCRDLACTLVHFSSDHVFGLDDTRQTPYTEADAPGPVNVYGLAGSGFAIDIQSGYERALNAALPALEAAYKLGGAESAHQYAAALTLAGRSTDAIELLRQAQRQYPTDDHLAVLLANVYRDALRLRQAAELNLALAATRPERTELLLIAGERYLAIGLTGRAVAVARNLRDSAPDDLVAIQGAVRLFRDRPQAVARLVRLAAPALRDARLARAFLALGTRLARERFASAAERGAVLRALARSVAEAVRIGPAGALADIELLGRPWDIDPAELRVPCLVLHGTDDPVVPAAHAAWYGAHLRGARVELVPATGHIAFLVGQARRIVTALGHPAAFERLETDQYNP